MGGTGLLAQVTTAVAAADVSISWQALAGGLTTVFAAVGAWFAKAVWSKLSKLDSAIASLDRKFVGHAAKTNQRLEHVEGDVERLRGAPQPPQAPLRQVGA